MKRWSVFRILRALVPPAAERRRGFLVDAIFGIGMYAVYLGVIGYSVNSMLQTQRYTDQTKLNYQQLTRLEEYLQARASSSLAIWTPGLTVTGATNCTSGNCAEIDFYANDSGGGATPTAHFEALLFTGTGVQRYTYYRRESNGTASTVVASGNPIPLSNFYVRDVPVTALSTDTDTSPLTVAYLAQRTLPVAQYAYHYAYPGVAAVNDVFQAHITKIIDSEHPTSSLGTFTDVVSLSTVATPRGGESIIAGYYAPTPPPSIDFPSGNSLVFASPSAPSQNINVTEGVYHNFFMLIGDCTQAGTTIATLTNGAQEFPNPLYVPGPAPPVGPVNQNSGNATYTFSPNNPGVCTVQFRDVYGQIADATITVMNPTAPPDPTYPPTSVATATPTPLGPEYMWGTTIQNPDTETTSWYSSYEYFVPGNIWFGGGSNAPEIGMAVGQTLYIDAACPPGSFSGSDSDYANDVQVGSWNDPWNEDPSGYQCQFTPTGPGWLAIGYWDGPGSPAGQLEFVQVGGYGGPYNNNVLNTPPPDGGDGPGGG